jgi:Dinucleotide-utilizing enzymes involved in molybdopterin and thiamine biosynthesis family 1
MNNNFSRTELLIGKEKLEKLKNSCVTVFGVGGVGSFVVEALARSAIGRIVIVDHDLVSSSNINRQLIADVNSIGFPKVSVMRERINLINPICTVHAHQVFCSKDNLNQLIPEDCDYIVDAIDTVSSKIELVSFANKMNIPIISSMSAGNKLDPGMFEISDIYNTSVCPLSRIMRIELKKRGISSLKVIYSKEKPIKIKSPDAYENSSFLSTDQIINQSPNRKIIGSIAFVPSSAGLLIAGEVVKDLIK